MDEDDVGFDAIDPHIKSKKKAYQVDFSVLSVDDIERRQKTDADSVASILAIQVSYTLSISICRSDKEEYDDSQTKS